jgi:patatin-like phospholipase/acyl hydrolase
VKRGLALDGGGVMGVIEAIVLRAVERIICSRFPTVRLCQIFDFVIGTSTGSILGSFIAGGGLAEDAVRLYEDVCPKLFGTAPYRNWWLERSELGKYSREAFKRELSRWIPAGRMRDLQTVFISVAECLEDGEPHYLKSDDALRKGPWRPDSDLTVMEAVERSALSAPLYFCPVDDEERKSTWIDGGSGSQNCPAEQAVIESIRRGWTDEGTVKILSLGTGFSKMGMPHEEARDRGSWRTIGDFATRARAQAEPEQFRRWNDGFSREIPTVQLRRVTIEVPKKINTLDGVDHMREYIAAGNELAREAEDIVRWLEVVGE